jgi:hypothetical protein
MTCDIVLANGRVIDRKICRDLTSHVGMNDAPSATVSVEPLQGTDVIEASRMMAAQISSTHAHSRNVTHARAIPAVVAARLELEGASRD